MKHRYFLLTILLLLCIFMLIPESGAAISFELLGDGDTIGERAKKTTKITDTDDVTFTMRLTGEAGDNRTISFIIAAGSQSFLEHLSINPSSVTVDGKGTWDVVFTISRTVLQTPGEHQFGIVVLNLIPFAFGAFLPYPISFVVNVEQADLSDIDISFEAVDSNKQTVTASNDATFTLRITNNTGIQKLQINLTLPAFGTYVSIDTTQVRLSKTSVTLASGASEEVTLTIPSHLLLEGELIVATVTATPEGGIPKSVIISATVEFAKSVSLESLDTLPKTATTTDTGDLSCTLRLTNTGGALDRIAVEVSSSTINPVSLSRTEVELYPASYEDITLTIPRAALTNSGRYIVRVRAYSKSDESTAVSLAVQIIVTGETQPTRPDLSMSTHKVVLSEFMFESEGGENSLPQWIELYNNSTTSINLRGWQLRWKRLKPSHLKVTTTFKQDFIIPAQQARVIVTALGRHSMGGNLSNDAVYQLHVLHAEELAQDDIANRNRLITRGGFSLKLINPNDVLIDQIGTLTDDKQTWQLHESLIGGVRSSLIRRFDEGVPRSGLLKRGWRRAYDTKRLVAGLYYGHQSDLGTPGYRRGKPLPVELSHFSARFDKDRVVITWTTESELNNAGFNILRSTSPTENFRPINPKLIQGAGTTGQRNEYQFIDKTAKPDIAYYYRLEDVDLSGTRAFLNTYRLRGVIAPTGKRITNWATLKDDRYSEH